MIPRRRLQALCTAVTQMFAKCTNRLNPILLLHFDHVVNQGHYFHLFCQTGFVLVIVYLRTFSQCPDSYQCCPLIDGPMLVKPQHYLVQLAARKFVLLVIHGVAQTAPYKSWLGCVRLIMPCIKPPVFMSRVYIAVILPRLDGYPAQQSTFVTHDEHVLQTCTAFTDSRSVFYLSHYTWLVLANMANIIICVVVVNQCTH